MSDLVICEICGSTYESHSAADHDVCQACTARHAQPKSPKHQKSLDNAKKQRSTAKFFGLKALKGSAKQKSLGETIRKELIEKLNNTHKDAVIELLASALFADAGWWIDRRNGLAKLAADLEKALVLRNQCNAMHANGESGSAEYNALAAQFEAIIALFK
jgi:hypothetical protein